MSEMAPHPFTPLSPHDQLCGYVENWRRCMRRRDDPLHASAGLAPAEQ